MPLAIEMPPKGTEAWRDLVEFNNELAEHSNGLLPPFSEEDFQISSVANSHSNMACRLVLNEMPSECEELCIDGKLSLHKVGLLSPYFAQAIREGFEWEVVCHEIDRNALAVCA